jgi:AcrR family transcriptional regulator
MPDTVPLRTRAQKVNDLKRNLILDAARELFEQEGLDGASLRGIAAKAGYTPAALYFHFKSKEDIYAEVLKESLDRLNAHVQAKLEEARKPKQRLRAAALGFFDFYAENPRDLDLGFYLFRGGMRPKGLGRERDEELNRELNMALYPIRDAGLELGLSDIEARRLMVEIFAHAVGLLLLAHTGRIRMYGEAPDVLMRAYLEDRLDGIKKPKILV